MYSLRLLFVENRNDQLTCNTAGSVISWSPGNSLGALCATGRPSTRFANVVSCRVVYLGLNCLGTVSTVVPDLGTSRRFAFTVKKKHRRTYWTFRGHQRFSAHYVPKGSGVRANGGNKEHPPRIQQQFVFPNRVPGSALPLGSIIVEDQATGNTAPAYVVKTASEAASGPLSSCRSHATRLSW